MREIKIYSGSSVVVSGTGVVEYRYCKYGIVWGHRKEFVAMDEFHNISSEVIGNIFENQELLGRGRGLFA